MRPGRNNGCSRLEIVPECFRSGDRGPDREVPERQGRDLANVSWLLLPLILTGKSPAVVWSRGLTG